MSLEPLERSPRATAQIDEYLLECPLLINLMALKKLVPPSACTFVNHQEGALVERVWMSLHEAV